MQKIYSYLKQECKGLDHCTDFSELVRPIGGLYYDATYPNSKGNKIIAGNS